MKKTILLTLCLLLFMSAYAANTFTVYGNNGYVKLNTSGQNGTFVCLENGAYCPVSLNASGTVTSVGTQGPFLTGGPITVSGTVAVNSSAFCLSNGTNCVASGGGSGVIQGVRSLDRYILVVNSTVVNLSINITALAENCSPSQYSQWNGSQFICNSDNTGLTLAQVAVNIGNFSNENATIARTGTCAAVDNATHISVLQNTTNGTQGCVVVAKNPSGVGSFSLMVTEQRTCTGVASCTITTTAGDTLWVVAKGDITTDAAATMELSLQRDNTAIDNLSITVDPLSGTGSSAFTLTSYNNSVSAGTWGFSVNNTTGVMTTANLKIVFLRTYNLTVTIGGGVGSTTQMWLNNWSASTIGNWTLDQPNYVNYSIFNTIGNWSSDRPNYVNLTALQNSTIVRAANCTAVDNTTHISVVQNISNTGSSCVIVAKNGGGGGSGGSGMTSFNINLSNNTAASVVNNSQLYFLNTTGILLSYVAATTGNFTWGLDFAAIIANIGNYSADKLTINKAQGWLNASSPQLILNNNITNVSIGARPVVWIDTSLNRTGFNTNIPGNTVEVNGTLNASTLLQGIKTVCLSDGTNCPVIVNVTSAFASNAGWLNGTGIVYLNNNQTNISVNYGALTVNTAQNRTGIGTNTPLQTLDVIGSQNITGTLFIGNTSILANSTHLVLTGPGGGKVLIE